VEHRDNLVHAGFSRPTARSQTASSLLDKLPPGVGSRAS
jgi:hypothetical protein